MGSGRGPSHGGHGGGPRINDQIRIPEIRLIGVDGHQYGVVRTEEARRIAADQGLDLVEVSPTAKPPVVKIIDYGKFKYQQQKKSSEAKKKQVVVQVKEIQFRPNIEKHDIEVKAKRMEGFLNDGDRVKAVMQFRGREMAYKTLGLDKFKSIISLVLAKTGTIESGPDFVGNKIIAMIAPTKKK